MCFISTIAKPILVLPWTIISLSDSRDTSCAIRFFSEPVPQLRDSWDKTHGVTANRDDIDIPPCKASNLIFIFCLQILVGWCNFVTIDSSKGWELNWSFTNQYIYRGTRETRWSTSVLVSRRSWVRIPPELPVKFFHRHSESTEYAVLYTRRCRAKLNQLFVTRRKNFTNLYWPLLLKKRCIFYYCTRRQSVVIY